MHFSIRKAKFIFVCFSTSLIYLFLGCQQEWVFSIISLDDSSHPEFCISKGRDCSGGGVSFPLFDVIEVDKNGVFIQQMWVIEAIANEKLTKIKYGTVPQGYKELEAVKRLELNKYYRVVGKYFFILQKEGNLIKSEILTHEEFKNKS